MLGDGNDLYVTVKRSVTISNDPRPYARYFVKRIELGAPSRPVVGAAINVPGEVSLLAPRARPTLPDGSLGPITSFQVLSESLLDGRASS